MMMIILMIVLMKSLMTGRRGTEVLDHTDVGLRTWPPDSKARMHHRVENFTTLISVHLPHLGARTLSFCVLPKHFGGL